MSRISSLSSMYSTSEWGPPMSESGDESSRCAYDEDKDEEDDVFGDPKRKRPRKLLKEDDDEETGETDWLVGTTPRKTSGQIKLKIVRQPEEEHRARYLSEGSRGAIKDRSGKSHCTIQLCGYNRPTKVEIYAGAEPAYGAGGGGEDAAGGTSGSGRGRQVTPHSMYSVIAVTGKGGSSLATPCQQMASDVDGTPCLVVQLRPEYNMTAVLDCVGILKICTYNMKKRLPKTNKNASVRLVFRALIPKVENPQEMTIIQAISSQIVCVQQLGLPEVFKISTQYSPATGGIDLFIIGRNFDRNTSVLFREYKEDGSLSWSAEAVIDKKLMHQCHIVCSVPTYRDLKLTVGAVVEVSMTVRCSKKSSHPMPFYYTADIPNYQPNPTPVSTPAPSMPVQSTQGAVQQPQLPQQYNTYEWADALPLSGLPPTTLGSTGYTTTATSNPINYTSTGNNSSNIAFSSVMLPDGGSAPLATTQTSVSEIPLQTVGYQPQVSSPTFEIGGGCNASFVTPLTQMQQQVSAPVPTELLSFGTVTTAATPAVAAPTSELLSSFGAATATAAAPAVVVSNTPMTPPFTDELTSIAESPQETRQSFYDFFDTLQTSG